MLNIGDKMKKTQIETLVSLVTLITHIKPI